MPPRKYVIGSFRNHCTRQNGKKFRYKKNKRRAKNTRYRKIVNLPLPHTYKNRYGYYFRKNNKIQNNNKETFIYYIPKIDFIARTYTFKVQALYRKKKYKKALQIIENIKKNSNINDISKQITIDTFLKNQQLRWYTNKMIFLWRQRKIKSMCPQNELSLDLEPVSSISNERLIYIYYKKTNIIYHFDCYNLIKTFVENLLSQEFSIAKPEKLVNPYTNGTLTIYQLISIFEQMIEKNIRLPIVLHLFKNASYNIRKFLHIYKYYLRQQSYRNNVKNKTLEEFNVLFKTFLETFFPNTVCFTCVVEKCNHQHRELFEEIIIQCTSYVNRDTNSLVFMYLSKKIINKYNLEMKSFCYKHLAKSKINTQHKRCIEPKKNRKIVRCRRRFIFTGRNDDHSIRNRKYITYSRNKFRRWIIHSSQ